MTGHVHEADVHGHAGGRLPVHAKRKVVFVMSPIVASLVALAATLGEYTVVRPERISAADETVLADFTNLLAKAVGGALKVAAAGAIADAVRPEDLRADNIIPSVFDPEVVVSVARACAEAARADGVCRS